MSVDYSLLLVLGIKVHTRKISETIRKPFYNENTGERLPDRIYDKQSVEIIYTTSLNPIKEKVFDEIDFNRWNSYSEIDKNTLPSLKKLSFFPRNNIIGKVIARGKFNQYDIKVPNIGPDIKEVSLNLKKMGINLTPELYCVMPPIS